MKRLLIAGIIVVILYAFLGGCLVAVDGDGKVRKPYWGEQSHRQDWESNRGQGAGSRQDWGSERSGWDRPLHR